MRVLIVDSSPVVGNRVACAVSEASTDVEVVGEARDAVSAAQAMKTLRPDVIVLDLAVPGGSGILKDVKRSSSGIVVVLGNSSSAQYRKRCLDAGAHFFLDKSTEFSRLVDVFRLLCLFRPCLETRGP